MKDIMEKVKALRINFTLSALIAAITGLIFIIWPDGVLYSASQFIGFVLSLIGLTLVLGNIFSGTRSITGIMVGALIMATGFWIISNPLRAASIIPMIVGLVLASHGIQNMSLAFTARRYNWPRWLYMLIGAIATIAVGFLCIFYPIAGQMIAVRILGIFLLFDGISSMIVVRRVNKAEKDFIDVDYREL